MLALLDAESSDTTGSEHKKESDPDPDPKDCEKWEL